MSSKAEVISKVNSTSTYIGTAVKQFINEVTCEDSMKPSVLKKGDVIKVFSGIKCRPSVVIKVKKDYVISIPLTSKLSQHCLCESESRFLRKGWFCNSYTLTPTDIALENFLGVYDNTKALNNAIKELRLFIVKNI
jgi:signal peptidase I